MCGAPTTHHWRYFGPKSRGRPTSRPLSFPSLSPLFPFFSLYLHSPLFPFPVPSSEIQLKGLGAVRALTVGSGAKRHPKLNSVHFSCQIWHLEGTILWYLLVNNAKIWSERHGWDDLSLGSDDLWPQQPRCDWWTPVIIRFIESYNSMSTSRE